MNGYCDWHNAIIAEGEDECSQCQRILQEANDPAHLDAKGWTMKTIIGHLYAEHDGTYNTARTTKAMLVKEHQDDHRRELEMHAMVRRHEAEGLIKRMRDAGCTRLASELLVIEDDWLEDHILGHKRGADYVRGCSA